MKMGLPPRYTSASTTLRQKLGAARPERPDGGSRARAVRCVEAPREAEVAELELTLIAQQQVVRLQVQVDDAARMEVLERAKQLKRNEMLLELALDASATQRRVEVCLHQRQDDEHVWPCFFCVDGDEGQDVRMRGGLLYGKLAEGAPRVPLRAEWIVHLLDCHIAAIGGQARTPNRRKPAFSYLRKKI